MLERYYALGKTGLKVSQLALGTMTFGTEWGWGVDKEASRALFDTYLDNGGNFFDTADVYTNGTSETWLGEFINNRQARDRAVIATKFTFNAQHGNPNTGGNGRKNILRAVEGSLRRLQTDYIDLYIMHSWDGMTPPEEVIRTLDDLVRAGKIRHVGLSNVPAWYASRMQTIAECRGYEPVSALQLEYSLVERNLEHEYTHLAVDYGMGFMAWSPLGSGFLSGKYKPSEAHGESRGDGEGRLNSSDKDNPAFKKFTAHNWKIATELAAVARQLDKPMAQVAINWVANAPGVASVLVGATRVEQLLDNLASLDFDIPAELRQRLDDVSTPYTPYPYTFFTGGTMAAIAGGVAVRAKPPGYYSH